MNDFCLDEDDELALDIRLEINRAGAALTLPGDFEETPLPPAKRKNWASAIGSMVLRFDVGRVLVNGRPVPAWKFVTVFVRRNPDNQQAAEWVRRHREQLPARVPAEFLNALL